MMSFEDFIKECSNYIDINKLCFEHKYTKDIANIYSCRIRKTNNKITMGDIFCGSIIYEVHYNNDFINVNSLEKALQKLKEKES